MKCFCDNNLYILYGTIESCGHSNSFQFTFERLLSCFFNFHIHAGRSSWLLLWQPHIFYRFRYCAYIKSDLSVQMKLKFCRKDLIENSLIYNDVNWPFLNPKIDLDLIFITSDITLEFQRVYEYTHICSAGQ